MNEKLQGFNKKEWNSKIKEAHSNALAEKEKNKQEIDRIIRNVDVVELLSHISLVSNYAPKNNLNLNRPLRDIPALHFLAALCLKNENPNNKFPTNGDIGKVIELLDNYFIYYTQELVLQNIKKDQISESDSLILSARLQKIYSLITPNIYLFQLEDLLKNIFSQFDNYFINKIGFSVLDAFNFGKKIITRYERCVNNRLKEAREAQERAAQELKDPIKGLSLREDLKNRNMTEKEFVEYYSCFIIFKSTKEIFSFRSAVFCKEEKIKEADKFKKYLKAVSCKFGEGNEAFNSPLDENLIITKPIINTGSFNYFCPIPHDLIYSLPLILENILSYEKKKQTKVWQKYQNQKAHYTESMAYEYLSRIFPQDKIFKNLKYTYRGKDFEVDLLIQFANKIFIVEIKSGYFTEPAKRGAIKRLKTDLNKLIEDAYQQANRAMKYIKSSNNAVFRDRNNKKVLELRYQPNNIDFFLINVTLESLGDLATSLRRLHSLGLFEENEYPWSINLFELDLITRHIPSPSIFIHYLEKRLLAQDENIFYSLDELSLLAFYLKQGNFYTPLTDNGKKPNLVSLSSSWVSIFDDHYLCGKDFPKLNIEPGLLKIIQVLELLHQEGYLNIVSALLDFEHKDRECILENIEKVINKSKVDHKKHNVTILFREYYNTGFTFIAQYGRENLIDTLGYYCAAKKYNSRTKRWIGIGTDVSDDNCYVNEFVFLDFTYEKDPKMDELVEKYPLKEK